MFAMFGLIKFAANEASTKSAERIRATRKKKAKKTAGKSARPNARKKTLKRESVAQNRKTAKKRPLSKVSHLSFEDQRRVDDYFIRKYNIVSFSNSNIPL